MSERQTPDRTPWWGWIIPVALGLAVFGAGRYDEWQRAQAAEIAISCPATEQVNQAQEGVTEMADGWNVEGAGADCNGVYLPAPGEATHNGQPYYIRENISGTWYLYINDDQTVWLIHDELGEEGAPSYAASAPLPGTWSVVEENAAPPAPTVTEWFSRPWPTTWGPIAGASGLGYIPAAEEVLDAEKTVRSLRVAAQGSGHLRVAIYDAADGALVMSSFAAEVDVEEAEDYIYVRLKGEIALPVGTYWLAVWTDDPGVEIGFGILGTTGQGIVAGTYPAWPNPAVEPDPAPELTRPGIEWPEAGEEPEIQSATWTLQADWTAGTGSNVDTTTRPGSVILQAEE